MKMSENSWKLERSTQFQESLKKLERQKKRLKNWLKSKKKKQNNNNNKYHLNDLIISISDYITTFVLKNIQIKFF